MRRVVVAPLVAGFLAACFSKPGLRDRDGGDDDGGGNGDGGGTGDGGGSSDGGPDDAPVFRGCQNWSPWTTPIGLFASGLERFGPWISPDALTVVYQSGSMIYQVTRNTTTSGFNSANPIYMANSSNDLQPFLSDDLMHLWIDDNSGNLLEATRTSTTGMFTNATALPGPIGNISETVEDIAVSGDGLRMIVTSGPSFQNEDLYMSSRTQTNQTFGALSAALSINLANKNDCCPAITDSAFLWTRETPIGSYEVREVRWDGDGHFAGPGAVIPQLNAGDIWHSPAITRDGTHLVVVRGASGVRELAELTRTCLDP